jgi:cyclopropane fatty-acyl-phospholipid synthase-like methyltransferase
MAAPNPPESSFHETVRNVYMSQVFEKNNVAPSVESTRHYETVLGSYLPKKKDSKILEIGVGMGHFAYYLVKTKGYTDYLGLDISAEFVDYVKERITPNVLLCKDTVEFLKTSQGKYDLIVMLDVIEHITKPMQAVYLKAVLEALTDNGVFFIRTENTAILSGLFQHTMDYTHEYNFSEISLEQLLRSVGFEKMVLFGDTSTVTGLRSFVHKKIILKAWQAFLKLIYWVERPGCINPKILTKSLYAVCFKTIKALP